MSPAEGTDTFISYSAVQSHSRTLFHKSFALSSDDLKIFLCGSHLCCKTPYIRLVLVSGVWCWRLFLVIISNVSLCIVFGPSAVICSAVFYIDLANQLAARILSVHCNASLCCPFVTRITLAPAVSGFSVAQIVTIQRTLNIWYTDCSWLHYCWMIIILCGFFSNSCHTVSCDCPSTGCPSASVKCLAYWRAIYTVKIFL